MCGLTGFAGPLPLGEADLARMSAQLRHRGPDDEGQHLVPGSCGLAFQRLSVVDLETGHQPLYSEDRRVVVTCNGEIYNDAALRERLVTSGHRFSSSSDAAVISHLYEEHAVDALTRLEGMFALALWDEREERLVLARDRMGVKPLYWAAVDGGLVYGSEPRAIFASGLVAAEPDHEALGAYMTLQYVPPPASGFKGVQKLAPGEVLTFHHGTIRTWRWWELDYPGQPAAMSDADALDRADELLRAATACRLRADVPLGAFLSGGIDSSLVVSYMAEALPQVRTFAIDFPVAGYGEGAHARRVADIYDTRHEEFVVEPDIVPVIGDAVAKLGEPFADSSAIPTYLLSQRTAQRVTVALSGDGGDEAFGGYTRYRIARGADRLGPTVQPTARLAQRLLPPGRGWRRQRVARGLEALAASPRERYSLIMSHFPPAAVAAMLAAGNDALANGARSAWSDTLALPRVPGVNRYMALDIGTYLPGDLLLKVDRMSMAHALEVRSPLLDHRVHEFGASLAARQKLRRGSLKWLLKELASRRGLPHDLVHRRKQGFGIPIGPWFRSELRTWLVDVLTDPVSRDRGYFRPEAVDELISAHLDGRADNTSRLWNLVMLELWHRSELDARA